MSNRTTKEKCFEKVRRHFNNDAMAQAWWFESNHMLGGISPYDMCKMGRADKLERVIDAWIDDNE